MSKSMIAKPDTGTAGPARRRRRQADRREESRERILDAAEALFAEAGFEAVSMRQIATESGVDTALIHYYFGTKAGVIDAVLERRADMVNARRTASLDAYAREQAGKMTGPGLVRAYLEPTFSFILDGTPGHRHYGALIARLNSAPIPAEIGHDASPFDAVTQRFVELLREVRPDCSLADLYWFYHMMSGAITLSLAQTGRIDHLSGGLCNSADAATILERMCEVFGQGIEALPASPDRPAP
ncbi:TetR/AcrR family transcriptional regulator [Maricaulis sp.]|uniref:TetR/AcrR family transcriptional regulator n=1 Tax=Maricaulis sp. TaxID=1486257 RepID=UPI001B00AF7D|nr:TetR/AcrR family transcriptional regulator [Maricaulis sp.]MBO6766108.1 TetR family transcriptional regulator [Maricaulis sp.]